MSVSKQTRSSVSKQTHKYRLQYKSSAAGWTWSGVRQEFETATAARRYIRACGPSLTYRVVIASKGRANRAVQVGRVIR